MASVLSDSFCNVEFAKEPKASLPEPVNGYSRPINDTTVIHDIEQDVLSKYLQSRDPFESTSRNFPQNAAGVSPRTLTPTENTA